MNTALERAADRKLAAYLAEIDKQLEGESSKQAQQDELAERKQDRQEIKAYFYRIYD